MKIKINKSKGNKAFGIALRQLRTKKNVSQEELAFQADLHRTYISLLETGQRSPTFDTILSICSALEISATALVNFAENSLKEMDVNHFTSEEVND